MSVRQIHWFLWLGIINIVNQNLFPLCIFAKNGEEDIAVADFNQTINLY